MTRLTVTKEQFDATIEQFGAAVENMAVDGLIDPVLLDEMSPDGVITTVALYDDDSIMLQTYSEEEGLIYNIVPDKEYWAGGRIKH